MRRNIYIRIIALLVCLILCFVSCIAKPEEEQETGREIVADDFTPALDNGAASERGKEYARYAELSKDQFESAKDSDFEYEEMDGGVKITKYSGEYELLLIPDTIDGKSVVAIGKEAFAANRWLSAIILPDSVKTIESLAFYGCNNLVYIALGKGIESVGNYAFAICRALYAIDLSDADSIGLGALADCTAINSLTLSFIGSADGENEYLGYIFGAEDMGHNSDLVPDSLRRVALSAGCTKIPDAAFYGCENITSVTIPDSVERIGIRAFAKCRSLVEFSTGDGVKAISDDAFFGCDNLAAVTLGKNVETIGMQAFFGCKKLEKIDLSTVKTIGSYAFYGCDLMTENE